MLAALLVVASGCGLACQSVPVPRNVLLVSIDALRADHVGVYGHQSGTTPFIDSLAADGAVFTRAYVPLPATDPSHTSLLTSLHPLEHGVLANATKIPDGIATLPEVLRSHGFFTMGAVAVTHLRSKYGFARGFDVFADGWDANESGNDAHRRDADSVNADVLRMIDAYARQRGQQPFFLFIHYFDVHAPYQWREAGSGAPKPDLSGLYDSGVRYVDRHLREVYERLEARGLTKNLLTIISADHGEQLGEHGYSGGHADIYQETVRIPLVVHGPGVRASTIPRPVSNVDVAVTILSRLGLSFPAPVSGRDLFASGRSAAPEPRPLVILGYPTYTRSLELIDGSQAFLRNLDYIYQDVVVEYEPDRSSSDDARGTRRIEPLVATKEEALFPVRIPTESEKLQELFVTVDVRLGRPECQAEVGIGLAPRFEYLEKPISFRGAIRVHYPATTRDHTFIRVRPGDCVEESSYRLQRFEEYDREHRKLEGAFNTVGTSLWRHLLTARKKAKDDELYDLRADAGMEHNLIHEPGRQEDANRLRALLGKEFFELARHGGEDATSTGQYSNEELELLKSLGYIQ